MDTKDIIVEKEAVIDDETLKVLQNRAQRDGKKLEDVMDKYVQLVTDLLKTVPPEVKAMQRRNKMPAGFDWKEEISGELYKKYAG